MRRSRKDIALGRRLTIGQTWRWRRDGSIWRVRQIHRSDCHVELERSARRATVSFAVLRNEWDQVIPADEVIAA